MSKIWFITGASSGFGKDLAEAVLARGDRAIITARRADALQQIAGQYGADALAIEADITNPTDRKKAVREALERFGHIDVLANIAGQGSLGASEEFSLQQVRDQMELNFFAVAELTRAVLPSMRACGTGHILNLTSIGGLHALRGFSVYCASKFALEGWSEAVADEIKPLGLHLTIVEPGSFRTEFSGVKNLRPEQQIQAYRPILEPIEGYLYGSDGKQPGDPRKAAAAMIAAVDSPEPPLRLLLGADAIGIWEHKRDGMTAELAQWRQVGENTAYDDAVSERPSL